MTEPVETLIEQLADPDARDTARARLVAEGASSVGPLLDALQKSREPLRRKAILQVLPELRDGRVEERLRSLLNDDDEEIRAAAAAGLRRLGATDALQACLATIDDAPDPLHYDVTPSVLALAQFGLSVLPSILPLLDSPEPRTRQHAQKVLELVTLDEVSHSVKPRALSDAARGQWMELWSRNGSYQWDASEGQRKEAMRLWEEWLRNREGGA